MVPQQLPTTTKKIRFLQRKRFSELKQIPRDTLSSSNWPSFITVEGAHCKQVLRGASAPENCGRDNILGGPLPAHRVLKDSNQDIVAKLQRVQIERIFQKNNTILHHFEDLMLVALRGLWTHGMLPRRLSCSQRSIRQSSVPIPQPSSPMIPSMQSAA